MTETLEKFHHVVTGCILHLFARPPSAGLAFGGSPKNSVFPSTDANVVLSSLFGVFW